MKNHLKRRLNAAIFSYVLSYNGFSFARRFNFFRSRLGFKSAVAWDERNKLYKVSDDFGSIFISRKSRLKYYKEGVTARLYFLVNEYLCDRIVFCPHDVIIDVGANLGEFSMGLCLQKNLKILAFEPDEIEFYALRKNMDGVSAEVYNIPLWSEQREIDFYPSNDTGDSSLIRQNDTSRSVRMKCFALDDILVNSQLIDDKDQIKLVKLEAEGAEPEILQGMKANLRRVEYISVDVGPERGYEKLSTLIPVWSVLMKEGFEAVEFGLPRAIMLFRNTRFDQPR